MLQWEELIKINKSLLKRLIEKLVNKYQRKLEFDYTEKVIRKQQFLLFYF